MEKRPLNEVTKIFEAITKIILRITVDLRHHASSAVHIINRVLRAHMRHIVRALNPSNTAKVIMSSLKLLTAMVAHSAATAREVLALYNMGHEGLLLLMNRTDKKVVEDVRICVLRFIMAFLITDDNHIVEQILTYRELMKSIFKEISRDRMSTLYLILPTMQRYIIMNPSVSKTQKLKLFNDYTLALIARIYRWQGMDDMQNGDDSLTTVRQLVHGFLLEVTSNLKYGINFYDKSLGTASGSTSNSALLKFVLSQKSVNDDTLVQELIVKILQTCPDILNAYLTKSSLSFTPRLSRVWQANMAFVTKVYSSLHIDAIITNLQDNQSVSRMVSMAMVATVPVILTQTAIVQGLKMQLGGLAIGYTLLEFIQLILNQSQKITQAFRLKRPDKPEFIMAYHNAVQKALPDINAVLPVFQRVLLKRKEGMSSTHPKSDASEIQQAPAGVTSPSAVQLLAKYMQILSLYQQILPSCFEQTAQDFSLITHNIFGRGKAGNHGNEAVDDEDLLLLQCHCATFLTGFPTGRFRWFKEVKGEGTAMHKLLTELTCTKHVQLKQHLTQLVKKLLLETGLFEHTPTEVSLWLDNLMTLDPGDRQMVVTFLQGSLTTAIRNPFPYNDRVADCVASGQSSRQQRLHGDQVEGKSFNIEDIPDITDISIDPSMQPESEAPSQSDDLKVLWPDPLLPCSALLPAALEKLTQTQTSAKKTDLKSSDSIADYITNVATTILHQQVDPLPLCLLLQQYNQYEHSGKPASERWQKMVDYSGYWLEHGGSIKKSPKKMSGNSPPKKLLKDLKNMTTFSASLQACFESTPRSLLDNDVLAQLHVKITELGVGQITSAARHVLLNLHTVLDMQTQIKGDTLLNLVDKHMTLIQNIINHASHLESKISNQIHDNSALSLMKPEAVNWDQLASIVLKHPVFLYWYQWVDAHNTGGLPVKTLAQARAISAVVIGYTLRFLGQFRIRIGTDCLSDVITPYARKTFLDLKTVVETYYASINQENESTSGETADIVMEADNIEMEDAADDATSDSSTDSDDADDSRPKLNSDGAVQKSRRSSKNSSDLLDDFSSDLQIFILLGSYVDDTILSNVIHSNLKRQDALLEMNTNQNDSGSQKLTHLGRVVCTLAVASPEGAILQIGEGTSQPIGGMLCGLLQSTGCEEFGKSLLTLMGKHGSHQALFATEEMLLNFLSKPTPIKTKVASELIKRSFAHRCQFESWCQEVKGQRSLKKNKDMLLPVLSVYWESCRSTESNGVMSTLSLLWDIYWPWLSDWLLEDQMQSELTSETLTQMTWAFTSIISMPKTTPALVVSLLQKLLSRCLETDQVLPGGQFELLSSMVKMDDTRVHVLVMATQIQQMTVLSADPEREPSMEMLMSNCHENLTKNVSHAVGMSSCPELPQIWKQFIRQVLKNEYNQALLHNLLASLIPVLYGDPDIVDKLVPLERLYQMIVSHSQFLAVMLAESDGKDGEKDEEVEKLKGSVVQLLLAIASLEPSCCQTSHFTILLGAYSASLLQSDQNLLGLMSVYENNNAVMWQYRPYMWGPVVITQHAARKALGHDLWQQPTMREVLELLDPAEHHQSALNFPLHRKLHKTSNDDVALHKNDDSYDPCFLLPLFSHLLAPESVADCKKFVECHGMEYVLAALGSYDPTMRSAAYHILTEFHQHIMGAKMMGKRELMYVLECLRNSLTQPNCRLPNVVALFIGRMTTTMLSPSQHIYTVLVQFLTIKPQIQLNSVPMFHRLFYSTNLKHRQERDWMMQLLLDGLRDAEDFQVYEKTGIFKTLLTFQLSVLCGDNLKTQIFDLLEKACVIPEAAHQLIRQHSLLTWIDAHINGNSNISSLERVITLLDIICKSVLTSNDLSNTQVSDRKGQQEVVSNTRPLGGEEDSRSRGRYSLPIGSLELIYSICVRLLDHLKPISAVTQSCLQEYLETLSTVFRYHTMCNTKTMQPSGQHVDLPLQTRHVAKLLHLYASVLKHTALLSDLAEVSTVGSVRATYHGGQKVPSHKNGGKDADVDAPSEKCVDGSCAQALLGIITHWRLSLGNRKEGYEQTMKCTSGGEKHQQTTGVNKIETLGNDVMDMQFVLVVVKWVLSAVSSVEGMTGDHWCSALAFVRSTIEDHAAIQHCLIEATTSSFTSAAATTSSVTSAAATTSSVTNAAATMSSVNSVAKEVIQLLLKFYTREGYPFMKSDETFNKMESEINQIFLQLVSRMKDGGLDASATVGGGVASSLMKATYREALDMCRRLTSRDAGIDTTVANQLTALLIQELWMGNDAPRHFSAAWRHCIEKRQRLKKKGAAAPREVTTDGAREVKGQRETKNRAKNPQDLKVKKRMSSEGGDMKRTPKKKKLIKNK